MAPRRRAVLRGSCARELHRTCLARRRREQESRANAASAVSTNAIAARAPVSDQTGTPNARTPRMRLTSASLALALVTLGCQVEGEPATSGPSLAATIQAARTRMHERLSPRVGSNRPSCTATSLACSSRPASCPRPTSRCVAAMAPYLDRIAASARHRARCGRGRRSKGNREARPRMRTLSRGDRGEDHSRPTFARPTTPSCGRRCWGTVRARRPNVGRADRAIERSLARRCAGADEGSTTSSPRSR